jgi:RimJ/RimL family protein N-acetyltransferase
MVKEISFRSITLEDTDLLLGWRNDSETRKNSIGQKEVNKKEHLQWIKNMLRSKTDCLLLIAELDGRPVGSFRLDKFKIIGDVSSPDMRLISYVVAPDKRGRGIGQAIVSEGCRSYGQSYDLLAKIRADNVASRKILESCDFECLGEVEEGIVAYARPSGNGPPTLQ